MHHGIKNLPHFRLVFLNEYNRTWQNCPREYVSFVKRLTHTHFLEVHVPHTLIYISQVVRPSSPLSVSEQVDSEEEVSDSFPSFIVHFTGSDSSVCAAANTGEWLTLTNICFQKGRPYERHLMIPYLFYWRHVYSTNCNWGFIRQSSILLLVIDEPV